MASSLVESACSVEANGKTMLGQRQTLARCCSATTVWRNLICWWSPSHGCLWSQSCLTPALGIIEANTLLSGIGFESGRVSSCHAPSIMALQPLLGTSPFDSRWKSSPYGTLVQLFLENRPKEELNKYLRFYQQIGMPTTLKRNASWNCKLWRSSQGWPTGPPSEETIHQMPFEVEATMCPSHQ